MLKLALHFLFFLSGAAALGYQFVWSRMFSTGLGHEFPAVLAIVAALMAGMALGAVLTDRRVPRTSRAGLWLGALELAIGLWGVATIFLIPHVNDLAPRLIGLAPTAVKHWTIAFALPTLALLPATVAMGATFPAMEKFSSALAPHESSIGSVYAANTFGAVAGTLAAPFVLMPALGLSASCLVLAVLNVLVGGVVLGVARMGRPSQDSQARATPKRNDASSVGRADQRDDSAAHTPIPFHRIALTLSITGLLGIGYEAAGVRVLAQVWKGTVFTYAAVLAVFLFGTAAGAAAYHRWWRKEKPRPLLATLLCGTALACFAGMLLMTRAPWLYQNLRNWGDSGIAVLMGELITAAAAFALPTFCMGATFSHLMQMVRAARADIGGAVALNTLGAALAPVLCGVILIPAIGTKWTLVLVSSGYALLLPTKPNVRVAVPAIIAFVCVLFTHLCIISVPPGGSVVDYREGVMASVAVVAEQNERTLRVDNSFQMGGTASADAEYRQAHIPLLLHPSPRRGLFLGVGTGISFGAASLYPGFEAEGVELVPEIVEAMHFFEPQNFSPQQQPNLRLHVADARRFVRSTEARYDVIIADLFHPYRDGAAALYTREHFAAVRKRLTTNGLFCQWLPLHQLDEPTLRMIVRTFLDVFPESEAWLLRFNVDVPVAALIGGGRNQFWSTNRVESCLDNPRLSSELKRLALGDSLRLFGHLLADAEDLGAFADRASLNTDDHPRVAFSAPRLAYQRDAKPYASLLALLDVSKTKHVQALHLQGPDEKEFALRLSRYLVARNIYLRGLIFDDEGRRDQALDAYLESARLSADFTSGYALSLSIANVIAPSDPTRAKRILERLVEAQPEQPVAKEILERLFHDGPIAAPKTAR